MEEKWCYRGEGNASIVAACPKECIVYRIRKIEDHGKVEDCQINSKKTANGLEFIQNIVKEFISEQFLVPMQIVKVPDGLIERIHSTWSAQRPECRLSKNVDLGTVEAIEMPDLCFIYPEKLTYSFEIKPKWGLLPVADYIANTKRSSCRFCMHQFLKIKQRKWGKMSSYCPIDLFSGCYRRMKFALQKLYACPQNNFRIFKNGQRIWDNEPTSDSKLAETFQENIITNELMDELFDAVIQCLCHSVNDAVALGSNLHLHQLCRSSLCDHSCDEGCHGLPVGSLLSEILSVQSLDDLDIESLEMHYRTLTDAFSREPEQRKQSGLDGPYTSDWLKPPSTDSQNSMFDYSVHKVKQFLVSRSAKDCSIFITIQEAESEILLSELPARAFLLTGTSGKRFICCVSVIDLDPKPFDKIPTYIDEERNVVHCFQESSQILHTLS